MFVRVARPLVALHATFLVGLGADLVAEEIYDIDAKDKVTYVTTESFEAKVLQSNLPVLVDFTATWCAPCKILDPIIDGLMPEMSGRAKVFKLDIDESPEIYAQFQLTGVPTVLFFNNGAVEDRIAGLQSRNVYVHYLEEMAKGTPALEIKIALLSEDSFRREFVVVQPLDVLKRALEGFPSLLTQEFENGQSPLSLILNSREGGQDERIDLVLSKNPILTLGDLVGLGRCDEFEAVAGEDREAVNRPDSDGNTPLLTALIQNGRLKEKSCLRAVLDAGADPGIQDSSTFTLSRAAVLISNRDFLVELLEDGLNPDHTDTDGKNALHWSAYEGFPPTVRALLEHGMDPSTKALNGDTAADIVRRKRDQWITALGENSSQSDPSGVIGMHNELLTLLEGTQSDEF